MADDIKRATVKSTVRAQRNIRRNRDREHRKLHVPLANRAASLDPERDRPPPATVVVMGPPGCGKTTLIRSLAKRYTRQNLRDVLGPCTVVSGKPVNAPECTPSPRTHRAPFVRSPANNLVSTLNFKLLRHGILITGTNG